MASTGSSASSAVGGVASGVGPPTTVSGFYWIAGFGVFSFAMIMAAESDKFGEVAVALTWLIGLGATVYWWNSFDTNLAQLIGQTPQTVVNPPNQVTAPPGQSLV